MDKFVRTIDHPKIFYVSFKGFLYGWGLEMSEMHKPIPDIDQAKNGFHRLFCLYCFIFCWATWFVPRSNPPSGCEHGMRKPCECLS